MKLISTTLLARERNDEDVRDCVKFISALSAVDGALVITDKLRVLGFGAEVIATSPALKSVKISTDVDGGAAIGATIESYGTRHRSAFRFCSSYEQAIAFVVSSDGGFKAVKRVGGDVIVWPQV